MFKLIPAYKDYIWGGTRLVDEYGKTPDRLPLAESWELSAHENGPSVIANGVYAGMELRAYLAAHPEAIGPNHAAGKPFPILVKLIDAREPLSVQVHPNDAYAITRENSPGKTELWYILEAEEGAFLYLGLNRTVTPEEFSNHIKNNAVEQILNRVPVKPGEAYLVEAGTLHAIGAGIVLAEVQQNSDLTYRVYDFGRLGADGKPRPLHIDQALEASDFTVKNARPERTSPTEHGIWPVVANRYFSVSGVSAKRTLNVPAVASFQALLCTKGALDAGGLALRKGETVFLPAGEGCTLKGEGELLLFSQGV